MDSGTSSAPTQFKVGDRVKLTDQRQNEWKNHSIYKPGAVFTVKRIEPSGTHAPYNYYVYLDDIINQAHYPSHLKLVKKPCFLLLK